MASSSYRGDRPRASAANARYRAVIAAVSGPDFDMPRRYIRFVCRVPAGQVTVTWTVW
jgi:hypothetical protein